MATMAKKKPSDETPPQSGKKRYPSREKIRHLAVPLDLYEGLRKYAESKSDIDDPKSINWAGRVAIRKFLAEQGLYPPK